MAFQIRTINPNEVQATGTQRHTLIARLAAGVPLLGIGLMHVFHPDAPMGPLVEAMGFPLAAVMSPVAVAVEIVAATLILLGFFARVGALLAIPTMVVATYAHLAIDVWPNGVENEPPLALPLIVMAAAVYILWRGAGRWSLDRKLTGETE